MTKYEKIIYMLSGGLIISQKQMSEAVGLFGTR